MDDQGTNREGGGRVTEGKDRMCHPPRDLIHPLSLTLLNAASLWWSWNGSQLFLYETIFGDDGGDYWQLIPILFTLVVTYLITMAFLNLVIIPKRRPIELAVAIASTIAIAAAIWSAWGG